MPELEKVMDNTHKDFLYHKTRDIVKQVFEDSEKLKKIEKKQKKLLLLL